MRPPKMPYRSIRSEPLEMTLFGNVVEEISSKVKNFQTGLVHHPLLRQEVDQGCYALPTCRQCLYPYDKIRYHQNYQNLPNLAIYNVRTHQYSSDRRIEHSATLVKGKETKPLNLASDNSNR